MNLKSLLRRIATLRLLNKFQQLTAREIEIGLYSILRETYKNEESLKQHTYAILRKMNKEEKLLERSNRKYSISELGRKYLETVEKDIIDKLADKHQEQVRILEMISKYLI